MTTLGDVLDPTAYAYQRLQGLGYSPVAAAGIVGNLVQESGVSPGDGTNGGDNGRSHGIAQWNGSRLAGLYAYAQQQNASPWTLDTQLGYLDHELKTTEGAAYARLQAASTVPEATAAAIGFERPQGWTAANPTAGNGWGNRLAAAQKVFGGGSGAIGGPAAATSTAPPAAAPGLGDVLPQVAAPSAPTGFGAPLAAAYAAAPGPVVPASPIMPPSADMARRAALLRISSNLLSDPAP